MDEHLIASAEHWERLADEDAQVAAWERERGIDLSAPGASAGDYRAAAARRCARTLRLQAATGEPHCMCHERPLRDCPDRSKGLRPGSA
jgi:hypothetical protein